MRNIDKIKLRSIVIKNKWRSLRPPLFVYNNAHNLFCNFHAQTKTYTNNVIINMKWSVDDSCIRLDL